MSHDDQTDDDLRDNVLTAARRFRGGGMPINYHAKPVAEKYFALLVAEEDLPSSIELLRRLPDLASDVTVHADVSMELLRTMARLANEVHELRERVAKLESAHNNVVIQKIVLEELTKLIGETGVATGVKVTGEVIAKNSDASSTLRVEDSISRGANTQARNSSAGLDGLASYIAGLRLAHKSDVAAVSDELRSTIARTVATRNSEFSGSISVEIASLKRGSESAAADKD